MIALRRRTFQIGGSKGVTLPGARIIGDEVSMAADRLLLMDTTGEIPEDKLLEFLNEYLEPTFWRWWETQKRPQATVQPGTFRPMEAEEKPVKTKAGTVAIPPGFLPGPMIYDITCPRCGRRFGWDVAAGGNHLYCLYCGTPIELIL